MDKIDNYLIAFVVCFWIQDVFGATLWDFDMQYGKSLGIHSTTLRDSTPLICLAACAKFSCGSVDLEIISQQEMDCHFTSSTAGSLTNNPNYYYGELTHTGDAGLVYAVNNRPTTSSATLNLDGDVHLTCPILSGNAAVKFRIPIPDVTGEIIVNILGADLSCEAGLTSQTMVMAIPQSHGAAWTGRFQKCTVSLSSTTRSQCILKCECTEACSYIQFTHLQRVHDGVDLILCAFHLEWKGKMQYITL